MDIARDVDFRGLDTRSCVVRAPLMRFLALVVPWYYCVSCECERGRFQPECSWYRPATGDKHQEAAACCFCGEKWVATRPSPAGRSSFLCIIREEWASFIAASYCSSTLIIPHLLRFDQAFFRLWSSPGAPIASSLTSRPSWMVRLGRATSSEDLKKDIKGDRHLQG